jgi:hypothetical protein
LIFNASNTYTEEINWQEIATEKEKKKKTICVQQGLFGLEGPSSRWPITDRLPIF